MVVGECGCGHQCGYSSNSTSSDRNGASSGGGEHLRSVDKRRDEIV